LIPFEPLSIKDLIQLHINVDLLGEIGLKLRSSFSNLSDITIDLNCLKDIGLKLNNPIPFLSELQIDNASLNNYLKSY